MKKNIQQVLRLLQRILSYIQRNVKRVIYKFNDYKFEQLVKFRIGKKITIDVADMFLVQFKAKELFRYDMIVRYLAVENFYGKNDYGFDLYRKMQDTRVQQGYSEKAVQVFKDLIESYYTLGYDNASFLVADKNLHLFDGSHRMALALYHNIEKVSVLVINSIRHVDYSFDWFLQAGFSDDEIDLILLKADDLKNKMNKSMSCVIWAPAVEIKDEILKSLNYFGTVETYKEYQYQPLEYQNMVKALYAIDDIDQWKIEKKLEYMGDKASNLVSVELQMEYPEYRIKKKSNLPISTVAERAKKALRSRFEPRIENYYFDIIMHIADNHMQSEYMKKVFEPGIDLTELLSSLDMYQYVLTKMDVPYMPVSFPEKIPAGKDIDILCCRDNFREVKEAVLLFFNAYMNRFELEIRDYIDRVMFRFNIEGNLIFLIDCFCVVDGLTEDFVSAVMQNRVRSNGYYIMDTKFEVLNRLVCYSEKPAKKYHLDYVKNHLDQVDADLAEKMISADIYKSVIKIVKKILEKDL